MVIHKTSIKSETVEPLFIKKLVGEFGRLLVYEKGFRNSHEMGEYKVENLQWTLQWMKMPYGNVKQVRKAAQIPQEQHNGNRLIQAQI